MKEQDFFKNFAKILGADEKLKELEQKSEREKRLLENLSKHVGVSIDMVEEEREVPSAFVAQAPSPQEVVELQEEVVLVEEVKEPEPQLIEENPVQPMPELPPEVVAPVVEKTPDKKQKKEEEKVPEIVRKELDVIKKSITDFHRFAQRHSQMGGGGEVNLRFLDDVDRSAIGDGKYLYYNASTKKFSFNAISGGGVPQEQSNWSETDNTAYSFIKNKPDLGLYQTTSDLSANVAQLTSNNAGYLGGIAANQYAYANATYDQILWINPSPSPATIFRTSIEATGTGAQINITTGIPGFGTTTSWVIDETGITFPNAAGIQTVPFVGDADYLGGIYADQYAYANSLANYQTSAGLSANVAKLSANNTTYLGGIAANQYAYSNSLTSYQTTSGLSANVAKLTANNTTYLGGFAANQYAYANSLTSYQTTAGLSANVATLTSNDSVYLGGIAANQYAYSNSLTSYQTTAGLSANVAKLAANNTTYLGGIAANQYAYSNSLSSYAQLNANVSFSKVTSNSATAFVVGDAAISGVALQMPREGAIRDVSNVSSTMYFDVSNGGSAHGFFNFRSSNSFTSILHLGVSQVTFNSGAAITGQTPYVGRTSYNVALDTVVTVDNLKFRISNQGGVFPQIASASGSTVDVCYSGIGYINGATNPAYAHNSGYILAADGTWLSIYSSHGMDDRGDYITFHITDKGAGKIYRVTYLVTNNSSNVTGYNVVVERII